MNILWIVLGSLLTLAGWALGLIGLSGSWLILVATAGFDLVLDGDLDFIVSTIVFGVLSALTEAIEFFAGVIGVKKLGGSRAAQVGAFVGTLAGGLAGSPLVPIVGTFIGALVGGFVGGLAGEYIHRRRQGKEDGALKAGAKVGLGAAIGRALVVALKASLATAMVVWFVVVVIASV